MGALFNCASGLQGKVETIYAGVKFNSETVYTATKPGVYLIYSIEYPSTENSTISDKFSTTGVELENTGIHSAASSISSTSYYGKTGLLIARLKVGDTITIPASSKSTVYMHLIK